MNRSKPFLRFALTLTLFTTLFTTDGHGRQRGGGGGGGGGSSGGGRASFAGSRGHGSGGGGNVGAVRPMVSQRPVSQNGFAATANRSFTPQAFSSNGRLPVNIKKSNAAHLAHNQRVRATPISPSRISPATVSPANASHGLTPNSRTVSHSLPSSVLQVPHHTANSNHRPISTPDIQRQAQQFIARAPHHVIRHRHCHWWFHYLGGVYRFHQRPWICHNTYWTSWTPCHYRVIRYQSYNYFVGLECITIPDIGAMGVQSVQAQSPAARAGLQEGDILVSVNGQPFTQSSVLTQEVATGRLDFEVLRDGSSEPTRVTVIPVLVTSHSF